MNWQSIAGQLAQIGLPALGTLFGGPLGGTIGGLVGKGVAAALGVEPTPQAVSTAIANDPSAAAVKLAQIEAETNANEAGLEDIANARATNVQLVRAGSRIAYGPIAFSMVATIGFVAVSVIAMRSAPGADRDVTLFLLGAWNTAFASVMAYWVGSSSGSRAKDAVIGNALASAGSPVGQAVGSLINRVAKR